MLRQSAQFAIPAAKLGLAYNIEGHKRLIELCQADKAMRAVGTVSVPKEAFMSVLKTTD